MGYFMRNIERLLLRWSLLEAVAEHHKADFTPFHQLPKAQRIGSVET
jgi:hypothetical protein